MAVQKETEHTKDNSENDQVAIREGHLPDRNSLQLKQGKKLTRKKIKKIVLAYSGGLDTSAIVPWLKEHYDAEIIAFVADVGQGAAELDSIENKALISGASQCVISDLRETFIKDYIFPTLKTGAIYEGSYLLGTAMARPVIAKALVATALEFGADAVSHGCTGKGNDQVRFESAVAALAPQLDVIAPWRVWDMYSREDLLDYLSQREIPTSASAVKIYSRDANVWHISTEGGELEDPWCPPSDQVWILTQNPEQAPDQAETVNLWFEAGELVAVNGHADSPYHLLKRLNSLAAVHGVGRVDMIENRLVGMKSRGCYETPGGTLIVLGMRALEELVLDKSSRLWREKLGLEMAQVLYDGRWFTPLREALSASAEVLASQLTGEVVLRMYKGQATVIQKKSNRSLYSHAFATFGQDEVYDQSHAEGFIRLFSLSSRIKALKGSHSL